MATIRVYLNEGDIKMLKKLTKKRNESQSSIIRKLISIEKYANALEIIEKHNQITLEYIYNLSKCGNNLNQIAYHLNLGIENKNDTENRLSNIIEEITQILNSHIKDTKQNIIIKEVIKKGKSLIPKEKFQEEAIY
ncbi:plasmid mobilization relaxosome protein MobC [Campylobacter sp. W0049]|uniref:plasmid mobilization relaxosome protein MobC n=1 Tax=Campylobacter molothri TaxID=1032242 RepID=UPI00301E3260|nr:plasmid mobilization relaxosome protein MobC [Campylobacter sp. W0049]